MTRAETTRRIPMTTPLDAPDATGHAPAQDRRRRVALAFAAVAVLGAAAVVAASVVERAQGRLAGSTSNQGSLFSSGAIDLEVADTAAGDDPSTGSSTSQALLVDVDNLVPGVVVERCLTITYRGSVDDADVRLSGRRDGGSGLERYLDTTIMSGAGSDPECADFVAGTELFTGTLATLWSEHGGYDRALRLADGLDDGDAVTVRVAISVQSVAEAQGSDTTFWLELEARP
jgi:hypothetical protein